MDFVQACFLFIASWISGVLNSVAGGGGLIIFPALIVTGLPAINANATSTLASSPGYIASISAYRNKLRTHQQLSWFLGSVSIAGGIIGATLLLHTPTAIFNKLVPYLMLIATVIFTFGRLIETRFQIVPKDNTQNSWGFLFKASFVQFVTSIYGGFYGLGISFLILASLSLLGIRDFHTINALKVLMMLCIDSFAILTFIVADVIAWQQAVIMMLGTAIGGYCGAYYARNIEPELIRRFVIVIAWIITFYFFIRK
jgi:uncharacterized protein